MHLSKASLRNANRAFRTQVQIANAKSQKVNEAVFQKGPPKRQIANFRSWTHGKFQIALGGRFETPTRGPSIREVCIYFTFLAASVQDCHAFCPSSCTPGCLEMWLASFANTYVLAHNKIRKHPHSKSQFKSPRIANKSLSKFNLGASGHRL